MNVRVIGGGLAGSEAALALSLAGFDVQLFDIKPSRFTPAHRNADFAELVCSNSLKSDEEPSAGWLLKQEMKRLGSRLIPIAERVRIPAGGSLSVDRTRFARAVTDELRARPNIEIVEAEYETPDDETPTVLATGPLTTHALSESLRRLIGREQLYFFDAAAPVADASTLDRAVLTEGSRYSKGEGGYLNCPMTREQYDAFVDALTKAETVKLKDFEGREVFEGCMPIEVMAKRGRDTLRFGPMKPQGLGDWYAAVQLRPENAEKTSYNLVGFQTNLTIPEQKRVFRMIPGLSGAEFFRYGVMHRNTYLDCPKTLDKTMRFKNSERLYAAGQLSGVEGYVESMASGLAVARYLQQRLRGEEVRLLPRTTMIGALLSAITIGVGDFQPINANFGLLPPLPERIRDKTEKYRSYARRAFRDLDAYLSQDVGKPQPGNAK